MSAAERDFSDFNLGDNVYELADGLIPAVAERLEVEIGDEPSSEALQTAMNQAGKNKVLRENAEVTAFSREEMVGLVDRSGVQNALRRSLWTPDIAIADDNLDAIVLTGGVANWQDRMPRLIEDLPADKPVYVLGGTRVMDGPTEKLNPNVKRMQDKFSRYPTEAEYIGSLIVPKLVAARRDVMPTPFATGDGDTMFAQFFEQNPHLVGSRLGLARVANAGVIMAIQMRDAARRFNPEFDTDPDDPQVFVATDSFPVSRTEVQDSDAAHFQKAATALRQVVLTAKKLHEAAANG